MANDWHQLCGNSSVGRAQPCQGWGREFESRFPLQIQDGRFFEICKSQEKAPQGAFFVSDTAIRHWKR